MYCPDTPIESSEHDLLGRAQFAKHLAMSLLRMNSSESFTVGIYGNWGTGKTSVLNMVQKELERISGEMEDNEKPLIMRFEPWNYSDCNQLLQQFFAQLSTTISLKSNDETLKQIGETIEQYASALDLLGTIPVVGKFLSIIPSLSKELGGEIKRNAENRMADISAKKDAVINELKRQKKRILIFIDDIDRLTNDQIRLIFQLVCAVAGFPNVIYVLSFDKRIVSNALSTLQSCDGNEYLEKIIQIPFELPEIDKSKIHSILFDRLDGLVKEYSIKSIEKEHWSRVFRSCVAPFVHTLRDVIRITNTLDLKFSLLGNEVNFSDLVAVSVFQTIKPQILTYIQHNKSVLVGSIDPYEAFNEQRKKEKGKEEYLAEFSSIDGINAEEMLDALSTLFPKFARKVHAIYTYKTDDELRREKRLAHIDKYDLYMSLSLEGLAITESDVHRSVYSLSEDELTSFLQKVNADGHAVSYMLELKSNVDMVPQNRIPMFIWLLIEHAYDLTGDNGSIFSATAKDYAEHIAERLLLRIPTEAERLTQLMNIVDKCTSRGLQSFSTILNRIELSLGRLAARGEERGEKIISLQSLEILESCFLKKITAQYKEGKENVLAQPNSRMLCYLWEQYDKDAYRNVLDELLQSPENVCRFISLSSSKWIGSGISWTFSDEYSRVISKDDILENIDKSIHSHVWNDLPDETKEIMAAFVLWNNRSNVDEDDRVTDILVQELLKEWNRELR